MDLDLNMNVDLEPDFICIWTCIWIYRGPGLIWMLMWILICLYLALMFEFDVYVDLDVDVIWVCFWACMLLLLSADVWEWRW